MSHVARTGAAVTLLVALAVAPAPAEASPCDVRHPSDERIAWACRRLRAGETLEGLFAERWVDVARFNRIDRRHARPGVAIKVPAHLEDLDAWSPLPAELPEHAALARMILIDLSEQFLGAYEHGRLAFAVPATTGKRGNATPAGTFRVAAADRRHRSSRYTIARTRIPYPMHFGLRFLTTRRGVTFWIHGRDLPGRPASHGCVGLYDEAMQRQYYGQPAEPVLADAQRVHAWAIGPLAAAAHRVVVPEGPLVVIRGVAPR